MTGGNITERLAGVRRRAVIAGFVAVSATIGLPALGWHSVHATQAPSLTGADPAMGPAYGGTTVRITGSAFTGATAVLFGTTKALYFRVDSDTQVIAASPAESPGTVTLQVSSPGGDSSVFGAPTFTYTSWSMLQAGSMQFGGNRTGFTATTLPNGKVLVAGGELLDAANQNPSVSNDAELYDPATDSWTITAHLSTARVHHTATLLANGRVLVAGGCPVPDDAGDCPSRLASAEIYDPAGATWTSTASLSVATTRADAILLEGPQCSGASPATYCGKVLVTGGQTLTNETGAEGVSATQMQSAVTELFDPSVTGGAWSTATPMTEARIGHTMTPLADGTVLVAGGGSTAETYDPTTGAWLPTNPPVASPRIFHVAATLPGDGVLVAGGCPEQSQLPIVVSSGELEPRVRTGCTLPQQRRGVRPHVTNMGRHRQPSEQSCVRDGQRARHRMRSHLQRRRRVWRVQHHIGWQQRRPAK